MYDPMTVAFEIKRPWREPPSQVWPDGYRPAMVTVWHVEPHEHSCPWSFPEPTDEQVKLLRSLAWNEAWYPYFMKQYGRVFNGPASEAEAMYRALVLKVASVLDVEMTFDEAARFAAVRIHGAVPGDGVSDVFCFEPGYHSNNQADRKDDRERYWLGVLCAVARGILQARRPWYRHPRWHFWHWRVQVHPVQEFKRWMWSRCARCAGSFRWGESVFSHGYSGGGGPSWFRSERGIYHEKCSNAGPAAR